MKVWGENPVISTRRRLNEFYQNNREKQVIFVSATLGSGKTKMVEGWLKESAYQTIWFTCPWNIDDEQWIWERFCQAAKGGTGAGIWDKLKLWRIPQTAGEIRGFLSAIEEQILEKMVVVVDDYQECRSDKMKSLLEILIHNGLSAVQFIMISRQKPTAFYSEMVLKESCAILGQSDLDFTKKEISRLFADNRITISEEELLAIYKKTEGWTASVYLILREYLMGAVKDTSQNIKELLRQNVYETLAQKDQFIVKQLSVLESFTRRQAVETTGDLRAAEVIDALYAQNCFIRYNDSEKVYSMHTLLRDMLKDILEPDLNLCRNLWNKCGDWYAGKKEDIYALKYYGMAENYEAVLRMMEHAGSTEYMDAAPALMKELFQKIPLSQRMKHPAAYLAYLSSYIFLIDPKEGTRLFEQFKGLLAKYNAKEMQEVRGEILLTESLMHFNDMEAMCNLQKEAFQAMAGKSSNIYGAHMDFTLGCPDLLLLYYQDKGMMAKMVSVAGTQSHYFVELCHGCGSGCGELVAAQQHLYAGELDRLENLLCEAQVKSENTDQYSILGAVFYTRLKSAILTGNINEEKEARKSLEMLCKKVDIPSLRAGIDISLGYASAVAGEFEQIPLWLREGKLDYYNTPLPSLAIASIVYGFVLVENQRYHDLLLLAEGLVEMAKNGRMFGLLIYADLFRAAALEEEGKKYLKEAIEKALADHFWLPFMEMSPYLLERLKRVTKRGELLHLCKSYFAVYHERVRDNMEFTFTEREKQVIRLFCSGHTRVTMAERLCISEYTVKRHISNIYEKLQVRTKTEAIKKLQVMK